MDPMTLNLWVLWTLRKLLLLCIYQRFEASSSSSEYIEKSVMFSLCVGSRLVSFPDLNTLLYMRSMRLSAALHMYIISITS